MYQGIVYVYLIYYGLKTLEKDYDFLIDDFMNSFEKDIDLEDFINDLVLYKFMSRYAKYTFYSLESLNYESFKSFIRETDSLNDENLREILLFLMCCYMGYNFRNMDDSYRISKIVDIVFNAFEKITKTYPQIFKNKMLFPSGIFLGLTANKLEQVNRFINTGIISINEDNLPVYLHDYILCVEDRDEDSRLMLSTDEVAMTSRKKDVVSDLLSRLECLAEDDISKDSISELKKELFGE